jgi:hypothetical protein
MLRQRAGRQKRKLAFSLAYNQRTPHFAQYCAGDHVASRKKPRQSCPTQMGFSNASHRSNEEALRLERLRGDVRERLLGVISDWSARDQSEIVEKIVRSETQYPAEAVLRRIRARVQKRS